MANFNVPGQGDLSSLYLKETDIIDRYVGNFLWVWGQANVGQLGAGSMLSRSSPVQTISGGNDWKSITHGSQHVAAIKTDSSLWLWGWGGAGQLGQNSDKTNKSSPVQTVAGGNDWKQVAAGNQHTFGLKDDGTLWTWGVNNYGQLGTNDTTNRSSPVQTISGGNDWKQISSGLFFGVGIKKDNSLWSWGVNANGQLGDNSTNHRSSPVQTIVGGNNWKLVSSGSNHTAAIKTDGTLWCWGFNNFGQLGDNTIVHRSSPVQTISGGNDWKQVACGWCHILAIKDNGTLWTWGVNNYGQLGNNTGINKSSPVQTVAGGNDWKTAFAGPDSYVSSAIKTNGTLWTWGRGQYGQLGDNSTNHRSSPVQTTLAGTNWKQASFGTDTAGAITYTET